MHGAVLGIHVVAGALGLALGPVALIRRRALDAYRVAAGGVCASALGLALLSWSRLWPLAVIAVATGVAVVGGWEVTSRRPPGWRGWSVRLTAGSYLSLVTALVVVSWGGTLAWVLPSVVGVPVIERAAARAEAQEERTSSSIIS